ncbi:hypothetical protein [Streptomyces sp. NPDC090994]
MRWAVAADGTVLFRLVLRGARPGPGRAFKGAVGALDRRSARA